MLKIFKRKKKRNRNYEGAKVNRITHDWKVSIQSADEILRKDLRTLRLRSRELARNNDYIRKFNRLIVNNIVGPTGIRLQVKSKFKNGKLDKNSNDLIEKVWKDWGKKGNCEVTGQLSWIDLQRLVIESAGRDGEVLIRKIRGYFNNSRFALQILEADYLDVDLNRNLSNGNYIRMGIQFNRFGRPTFYHLRTQYPNQSTYSISGKSYVKIPANEIIHLYIKERPTQNRGVPWCHAAMTRVHNIGAYEEAEIIAARTAASKMGFFESDQGDQKYEGDGKDEKGNVISEVEPGLLETLPSGLKFVPFDPHHPSGNYESFMKRSLKGISSGIMVSYNSLANDLEAVNYSSIRAGSLEERDEWRVKQNWFITNFCNVVFEDWLMAGLLNKAINLPIEKFEKLNQPSWHGRGWAWVDPLKDMKAAVEAVNNKLKTRQSIAAEYGMDYEEIVEQLAFEEELIGEYNITTNEDKPKEDLEEQ